ncbi:MAG TPA: FMN-binding negative transcriptional regulator [Rhabdaerophilum sp.]|nr:FMN-binding negative transcriptional regulator [Rhabdaerophilum sp.]
MYEPAHFKIEDREELFAVIRANALGLLISQGEDGIVANPIPFVLAKNEAGGDVLRAHLARANPQWKAMARQPDVLVVFQGTDHYVTPAWYAAKREHGKVVPTWNYVHVQVRGRAVVHDDPTFVRPQVEALTAAHETGRAEPWAVDDAPERFIEAQMRGIVGLEIPIEAISGKFKLSQNRSADDYMGVQAGLADEADAAGPAMAEFIRQKRGSILP